MRRISWRVREAISLCSIVTEAHPVPKPRTSRGAKLCSFKTAWVTSKKSENSVSVWPPAFPNPLIKLRLANNVRRKYLECKQTMTSRDLRHMMLLRMTLSTSWSNFALSSNAPRSASQLTARLLSWSSKPCRKGRRLRTRYFRIAQI